MKQTLASFHIIGPTKSKVRSFTPMAVSSALYRPRSNTHNGILMALRNVVKFKAEIYSILHCEPTTSSLPVVVYMIIKAFEISLIVVLYRPIIG